MLNGCTRSVHLSCTKLRLYRACSISLRCGRPQWYPDLAQARAEALSILADRDAPQKSVTPQVRLRSRRCTSAHTKAVPALHVRSYKSAGWTGLTALRSWQFTSTSGRRRASPSIPPYYSGVAGGLANISEAHGPSFVTSRATCEMFGRTFLEDISFRLQLNKIRLEVLFGPPTRRPSYDNPGLNDESFLPK